MALSISFINLIYATSGLLFLPVTLSLTVANKTPDKFHTLL